MKIIEALKLIKDLQKKASDLRSKVANNCALLNYETPLYGEDQKSTVDGWIQAHGDILKEILMLRLAIQRTNLATDVTIEIGGKNVTKPIAAWIHRRRDLADAERQMWASLSDRGLQEGQLRGSTPDSAKEIKIVRFYDPHQRDEKVETYRSEQHVIDATLEIVNATTDLIE